ncbi:oligoendopeptidase, pepF/M3 family [Terribacillus aidingensis]|uniref:Oligoendopeptidase, pepF/M3 family n=1 Tax=Terribacillus aidingensis TaxID=586416 RepID=A0A285NI42_9BACI|nr:M3 family oligoendopeptidase [Terribacillus aidingensis]SNZ09119.1 oligoendopeptidase, pepF/M3 family [Terribacillus aidingensis]
MTNKYGQTWDLDVIFPGGSNSSELSEYAQKAEHALQEWKQALEDFQVPDESANPAGLLSIVEKWEASAKRVFEVVAFVECLVAQDVTDKKAKQWSGKKDELMAAYSGTLTGVDKVITQVPQQTWEQMLEKDELINYAFVLEERRKEAVEKLSPEQEVLLNDLAIDGYHGWGSMYDTIVSSIQVPLEIDGEEKTYSVGQAANKLDAADRKVRQHVFGKMQEAWTEKEDFFAETLNHLAGFRLQTYKHRKWDNVLKEPLAYNRMSQQTLNAMWGAISDEKDTFVKYLQRKADLLGLEKLSWYDIDAPLSSTTKHVTYDEAADFIVKHFRAYSTQMADFSQQAFEKRWIEAEDRNSKRPGGFCTSFPDKKESRIFMTFSGTANNVSTLAHELGHAYHSYAMNDVEQLNQEYAMNVAETASTLAELIVSDAAVKEAATKEEKIALIEEKIQRSIAFFMNIHARFLFETRFYEERKNGLVSAARLRELMVDAQKEAYSDQLGEYDPTFWASKLHFYATDVPFYNFPYTFGFLFSTGIYAKAADNPETFESSYNALLEDTGRMTVEDLAMKHLQEDLTQKDFWLKAIEVCKRDVEEFLRLTAK